MWCTQLAGNAGLKKSPKNGHLGTVAQTLMGHISSQLRHVSTLEKNLLDNHISPTCAGDMVNFSPLAAEISSVVWGAPGDFNGFGVLAALLHDTRAVGASQTLRR